MPYLVAMSNHVESDYPLKFWRHGERVVIRSVLGSELIRAMPAIVLNDTKDRTDLFVPVGTKYLHRNRKRVDGEIVFGPSGPLREDWAELQVHTLDQVMIFYSSRRYSIWMRWNHGSGRFEGWYVDLQTPPRRTAIGFDTQDNDLDIVVDPDLSWKWKDQNDVDAMVKHRVWTPDDAELLLEDGRRAIQLIESRSDPFSEAWMDYVPDTALEPATLPPSWNDLPVEPANVRDGAD